MSKPWKAQLFDCFSEPILTLLYALDYLGIAPGLSICASCYISYDQFTLLRLQGQDPVMRTICACIFCCFGYGYNRQIIRRHYDIQGEYISDCCCHFWCHCCAIIQEYREIKIEKNLPPFLQQSRSGQQAIIVQGQQVQMQGVNAYQQPQQYPSQAPPYIQQPQQHPQMNQPLSQPYQNPQNNQQYGDPYSQNQM